MRADANLRTIFGGKHKVDEPDVTHAPKPDSHYIPYEDQD
jgi:hypothetical protein